MALESWLFFVVIWTLAGIPLGPNALNCIALSVDVGFRRSLWAIVGILVAAICFMAAVILGFAAVLAANAEVFSLIKLCGAAYLVWMGISMWRKEGETLATRKASFKSPGDAARRAFVISMTNPKAILSYSAVFSQFVTPGAPLAQPLIILTLTALVITAAIYVGYCAIGTGLSKFVGSAVRRRVFNRSVGAFYVFAGGSLGVVEADALIGDRR
jgi:homoserine/homoserine lactone efflux protein